MAVAGASTWTCPTCGRANPQEFAVCPNDATPKTDGAKTAADPLIGEVLGRTYRIASVLGQGGMARLYEAEHLRIETRYAVKVIHDDLAHQQDLLARFEREARAAGRIRSQHVVRLVDVLRTADGRPCLVTELLEGEDLQTRLDRAGKATVAQAIPVARQICRAVADAHAVGVVHRDLKPSNVFLCKGPDGPVVKVFDFGVAKLEDDEKLTRTDAVMGTAAYMAPEQARKAADAGPLADVYSIGAILYHMLCGEPPYGNVPAVSRFALVLHEEPARPSAIEPSVPAGIEAVIQHAMARDPAVRIKSPSELDAQLAAFDRQISTISIPRSSATPPGGMPVVSNPDDTPLATPTGEMAAQDIELRAKIARPLAAFVAGASALALTAWLAAVLAVIIEPTSTGEHALLAIVALGCGGALAAFHIRTLQPRWRSGPAVTRHTRAYARALVWSAVTLGALELVNHGVAAVAGSPPLGEFARLLATGIVTMLALGWHAWHLDEKLRRRIG